MKEYIARDPKTGMPLAFGKNSNYRFIDDAYRAPNGYWDAIKNYDIIPLCNGEIQALEVRWKETPQLITRTDAIRALPRIMRENPIGAHKELISALSDIKPEIRISGLFSLPYVALVETDELFEHLHELLDDVDTGVRMAASKCLEIVAPVFPSVTEDTLFRELQSSVAIRRKHAYKALKSMCQVWPEVVVNHLDDLLRSEDHRLRLEAAKILPPLARTKSASVWDLIGWSLGDESEMVRAQAARTLPTLANIQPRMAKILVENSLFDTNEQVRKSALKALKSMDVSGFRMNRLCIDGARHSDPEIRRACILMMPRLFTESELRIQAVELLRMETKPDLISLLEEFSIDPEIDGGEDEKNRFLAAVPQATNADGTPILPPLDDKPTIQLPEPKDEVKKPSRLLNQPRRPTQDELFYGDDFDDGTDGLA